MSVMESLVTRRTYRRFAQKPVPQDVVDDIVEAVRLSSCGANRQALRLVVVQSPEMVAKVQPLVKWAAYLPPEQGMPKADETPTLYVAVLQDSSAPGDLSTDTGIALANMTLAAWDKEVGSCIMGAINKPALTELPSTKTIEFAPHYTIFPAILKPPAQKKHSPPNKSIRRGVSSKSHIFVPEKELLSSSQFHSQLHTSVPERQPPA